MRNRRHIELLVYRILDWIAASIAWFLFFKYRLSVENIHPTFSELLSDQKLIIGLLVIPLAWVLLYSIFDKYQDIYRYSRLATLIRTFVLSLVGVICLFFTIMIDDETYKYTSYINPIIKLFLYHFLITAVFRIVYLSIAKLRLRMGKVKYNTLIVGEGETVHNLVEKFKDRPKETTYNLLGIVNLNGDEKIDQSNGLPILGSVENLTEIIEDHNIEDVILAPDSEQNLAIEKLLNQLYDFRDSVNVKIIPSLYDSLIGKVKMNHINGGGLIEIDQDMMPGYEKILKRIFDFIVSLIAFILCIPLYLIIALRVKLSSKGPLIFSQKRIGKNGREFSIFKFRSMYIDAESSGPQLSQGNDSRITKWGKTMRKYRLDELPQFYNVLIGDMSLVGPRPERQFYIDQISQKAPLYKKLLKVRPGITSWGQVKYGYASDVNQMVERVKYDLIYLENMSIMLDIKIILFTLKVLIQGKGK